jgi:hypothetical protein
MESMLTWAYDVLTTTPRRWASLTGTLSLELLSRSPAPKEWSALECLQHLVDVERWVFPVRLRAFLAGQDFPGFDPDTQGSKQTTRTPPGEVAELFSQLRKASLVELAAINPADLARSAHHAELGMVTLGEMVHQWAAHDLMHTVQAERALMQPFIHGCGPWQPYFAEHVARSGPS